MRKAFHGAVIAWAVLAFHVPQAWLLVFLLFPKTGNGGWGDAAVNALLMTAWGGVHSLMARDFAQRAMARQVGRDFVKVLYVTVAGLTQCALLVLWRPLAGGVWEVRGLGWWVLAGLFLAAAGAVFASSLLLDYMETLGVRAVLRRMRGEPRREMPLSVRGPYAYCRHPVYLFTILLLWTGPVMNLTRLEFAFLGTVYILVGMFLEDRDTVRSMGLEYETYRKNVPMLIPRLTPWRPPATGKGGAG